MSLISSQYTVIEQGVRLTQIVRCGGCAAKLNPADLYTSLHRTFNISNQEEVLVGIGDDAFVIRQDEETALIFTTDIIAPIVDDPYNFGRIAAANSLSDVYAMGGVPFMALNNMLLDASLGMDIMEAIFAGASDISRTAGTIIGGGHTVRNPELRFGLSVVGKVHPNRIVTNSGGKPEDVLILTKPIGFGVYAQALKNGLLSDVQIDSFTNWLTILNDRAMSAMQEVGVHAATDVTGFGLAGHLFEMAQGAKCAAILNLDAIPVLEDAVTYLTDGSYSGNLIKNLEFVSDFMPEGIPNSPKARLIFDPQTSGGLLMAVEPDKANALMHALVQRGVFAVVVGNLRHGHPGQIDLV